MEEISRCPFCGREPELIKLDTGIGEYFIACKSMYCVEQKHVYMSKQAAIKAWNRRK